VAPLEFQQLYASAVDYLPAAVQKLVCAALNLASTPLETLAAPSERTIDCFELLEGGSRRLALSIFGRDHESVVACDPQRARRSFAAR